MKQVIHRSRALHALALILALLFASQPLSLSAPPLRAPEAAAWQAPAALLPWQDFWDTVAQNAGR